MARAFHKMQVLVKSCIENSLLYYFTSASIFSPLSNLHSFPFSDIAEECEKNCFDRRRLKIYVPLTSLHYLGLELANVESRAKWIPPANNENSR